MPHSIRFSMDLFCFLRNAATIVMLPSHPSSSGSLCECRGAVLPASVFCGERERKRELFVCALFTLYGWTMNNPCKLEHFMRFSKYSIPHCRCISWHEMWCDGEMASQTRLKWLKKPKLNFVVAVDYRSLRAREPAQTHTHTHVAERHSLTLSRTYSHSKAIKNLY